MTPFDAFLECGMVTTDTRNIIPGSVFFALKGTNFNGNDFVFCLRLKIKSIQISFNFQIIINLKEIMKKHKSYGAPRIKYTN